MTNKEIEKYEQRALEIARMPNSKEFITRENGKKLDTGQQKRFGAWHALALEVGASHISTAPQKTANEGELSYAIRQVLQTASMINTSKAAFRSVWTAIIAAAIAGISVIAAWAAVLLK